MDGVLVIDKPAGLTSHDVVDQVRRILHVRRVGHTGTLDPFATGVLVVMVGCATRLAQFLSGVEKEYEAVIRLGYATDTGDITGQPIPETRSEPGPARLLIGNDAKQEIETALAPLRGEIDQVPPMYSAKKQAGRKLYELARRGEEVERKPVRVCIYELEAINLASKPTAELLKDNRDGTFDFQVRVVCSAGTYIRTLAEDFGKRLGVGAHLAELRRTRAGAFRVQEATTLEQLKVHVAEESLGRILHLPDEALARLPFVDLSADDLRRVRNGMSVKISNMDWSDGEQVRLRDEAGQLVAVATFNGADGSLHPGVVIAQDATQKS
ncbi:MAG: tRNA pseudouridine(55) synthase TruB [Pyrinomonadaceae bacterium]|nr:tRNA pseudouridine(55) synthase TruB [Pyrinomonadaceae bacterium]